MTDKSKQTKEPVLRKDVLLKDKKVDLKKVPVNNKECNRMNRRFLYLKTGNYVVYGRMLQLVRKPEHSLDENDVIQTKD